jgi:STIP1 family protein 1
VFANRALTRLKLQDWPGAEYDARKAIELYQDQPKNRAATMKAHYYLAQALLPQKHVGEALAEAKYAYAICLETQDSSAELISQFILKAKQAQWQAKETARLREMDETLALVEDLLNQQLERDLRDVEERLAKGEIGETGKHEETRELEEEAELRRSNIRRAFQDSGKPDTAERVSLSVLERSAHPVARPVLMLTCPKTKRSSRTG